jgi:hypothetical protein
MGDHLQDERAASCGGSNAVTGGGDSHFSTCTSTVRRKFAKVADIFD